ncbi:hypothetical protein ACFY0N_30770 [Streptomyces vinaceus]|uniref:phage tail tube protein n=1 Tax=Streptomyces vinaceus TaxID=1960 RepID=UPI0036C96A18
MNTYADEENKAVESDAIVPKTGYIYVAPVGTPAPKFPFRPASVSAAIDGDDTGVEEGDKQKLTGIWKSVGNTSLENGIEMSVEGDDPEVLGSWQVGALAITTPDKQYSLTMNLNDITVDTMKLYYGGDDTNVEGTSFIIPAKPKPTKKALFIIGLDDENAVGWFYPNTSIIGSDAVTIDPSALTEVPVKAQILAGQIGGKDTMGRVYPKTKLATSRADFITA